MRSLFLKFGHRREKRRRLQISTDDRVLYAIGDVHGCYNELMALEARIVEDANSFDRAKLIVMLGDYVDRGADSRRVIEHLIAPPPAGFTRICLAGNHDVAMFSYLTGKMSRSTWLRYGGAETLFSYGLDAAYLEQAYGPAQVDKFIRSHVPATHVTFLQDLPVMAYSDRFVFVHAGIRPGVQLVDQTDADLLNIREEFLDSPGVSDRWIVHGHTRVTSESNRRRISLETGVYETGRLSALRIADMRGHLLSL